MKLSSKITVAALSAVSVALIVGILIQKHNLMQFGVSEANHRMASIVTQAESVRAHMADLHKNKAFDYEELHEELTKAKDIRQTGLFKSVPIVSALASAKKTAEEEGFQFRVATYNPRNPENAPNTYEKTILDRFEQGDSKELFEVMEDQGRVVYAKPIFLSQDCMSCHGDPKTSPTGDGMDILGMPMENWKAGEMHGAFILSNDINTIEASAWTAFWNGTGVTLAIALPLFLVISIAFYIYNQKFIIHPLSEAVDNISDTSSEQSNMSFEIANAANSVADGTSSQAASIEETSASIEIINENTRKNADHAREATRIAQTTRGSIDDCHRRMLEMNDAMSAIQDSAKGISVIIKTIDEIAFQTNLLALNAAVEAARAGEAGAGFAVVADEVRALANRSAEAAHETAKRIEDSVNRSQQGVSMGTAFSQSLQEMMNQIRDIDSAISEIAESSTNQHQNLSQITLAVGQMDTITQQHAAAAEETASAAATFAGKAKDLKELSSTLRNFIGESRHGKISLKRKNPPVQAPAQGSKQPPRTNGNQSSYNPRHEETLHFESFS